MLIYLSKNNKDIANKISNNTDNKIYVVKKYKFLISEFSYFFKGLLNIFLSIFKKKEERGLLGAGGADIGELFKNIGVEFVKWIISGLAWDLFAKEFLDNYKFFKTNKRKYIEILDLSYEPGSYHSLKFCIPNDLEEQKINNVLEQASKILDSMKNIRYYFGSKEIIFKYNRYWHIKIKKTRQFS